MSGDDFQRDSQLSEPELISDPDERAKAEARNALKQFDLGLELLDDFLSKSRPSRLKISDLLTLNRVALEGVNRFGGTFRSTPIVINGSSHRPPEPTQVPLLIEDFCDYINENFQSKSAIHLSAYALWRLNWIHPFADGNGRTARIVSYILLCARLRYKLPGLATIPEQISRDKRPYYASLEAADQNFSSGVLDVSKVEDIIQSYLADQLLSVHEDATSSSENVALVHDNSIGPSDVLEGDVVYEFPQTGSYRPMYVLKVSDVLQTANQSEPIKKGWIESNPALVTAMATIVSSILAVVLTVWFTK